MRLIASLQKNFLTTATMMREALRTLLLSQYLMLVSACGQTGALVLPGTQVAPAADTTATAESGGEEEDETQQ